MIKRRKNIPREIYLAAILVMIAIAMGIGNPMFLTPGNLKNIVVNNFEIGLICVSMTFIILTGGMDMSVGSIVGLSSMLVGVLSVKLGLGIPAAILGAVLCGTLVGVVNGAMVILLDNSNPMIITIGTMVLVRALCRLFTEGWPISGFDSSFMAVSYGAVFGINITILILFAAMLAGQWFLTRTLVGNNLYAVGNNENSTYYAGIKVKRIKLFIYIFNALIASLAGVFLTSRMQTSYPDAGDGYHMEAIAAIVIGGTSISGGEGTMTGALLGFFILAVLKNGLSLMGVAPLTQMIFTGLVLIVTIWINNIIGKREEKRGMMLAKTAIPQERRASEKEVEG